MIRIWNTAAWTACMVFLSCVIARKKPVMKKFGDYTPLCCTRTQRSRRLLIWNGVWEGEFFDDWLPAINPSSMLRNKEVPSNKWEKFVHFVEFTIWRAAGAAERLKYFAMGNDSLITTSQTHLFCVTFTGWCERRNHRWKFQMISLVDKSIRFLKRGSEMCEKALIGTHTHLRCRLNFTKALGEFQHKMRAEH